MYFTGATISCLCVLFPSHCHLPFDWRMVTWKKWQSKPVIRVRNRSAIPIQMPIASVRVLALSPCTTIHEAVSFWGDQPPSHLPELLPTGFSLFQRGAFNHIYPNLMCDCIKKIFKSKFRIKFSGIIFLDRKLSENKDISFWSHHRRHHCCHHIIIIVII